jgi:hypothetical protein
VNGIDCGGGEGSVRGARLERACDSNVTGTGVEPTIGIGGSVSVEVEAGVGASIGVDLSDVGVMGWV